MNGKIFYIHPTSAGGSEAAITDPYASLEAALAAACEMLSGNSGWSEAKIVDSDHKVVMDKSMVRQRCAEARGQKPN